MAKRLRLVRLFETWLLIKLTKASGIVGGPADNLLGFEGVEGAVGPRFRKLSKEEIEDYLTNL